MDPQPENEIGKVRFSGYVGLLRSNPNFRRLWCAQIVSEIGDWFYTLAIYNLLLQLTGRASSVALALVLQVLPQTLIGPTSGVVNDRLRRKQVMIAADLLRVVIVSSMLLVRSKEMVWLIYPLLLLETLMAALFEPARSSVIPNIVRKEEVVLANTLSSTTWSLNLLLGSSIGGIVAALLGRDAVFVLNALSFLVSAWFISCMRFEEPHVEGRAPFHFRELLDYTPVMEGIRYVRRHRDLLATVFVKSGNLVVGPSWVLFTVMGQTEFKVAWPGVNPERGAFLGMSFLLGARGLGALIGPLMNAPWAGKSQSRLRLGILFGYVACATGYALLGLANHLWIACACIVLGHIGGSTVWVFSTTLLQLNTEDRFRGRVFAADLGFCMLMIAVGAFIAGRLVDAGFAARSVASGAGLMMVLPVLLWGYRIRKESKRRIVSGLATEDAASGGTDGT